MKIFAIFFSSLVFVSNAFAQASIEEDELLNESGKEYGAEACAGVTVLTLKSATDPLTFYVTRNIGDAHQIKLGLSHPLEQSRTMAVTLMYGQELSPYSRVSFNFHAGLRAAQEEKTIQSGIKKPVPVSSNAQSLVFSPGEVQYESGLYQSYWFLAGPGLRVSLTDNISLLGSASVAWGVVDANKGGLVEDPNGQLYERKGGKDVVLGLGLSPIGIRIDF